MILQETILVVLTLSASLVSTADIRFHENEKYKLCPEGSILINGDCIEFVKECIGPGCPICSDNQVLQDGKCIPSLECPPDTMFIEGACRFVSKLRCPESFSLINGACVSDINISPIPEGEREDCESGLILIDGVCVEPPKTVCPTSFKLDYGKCVPITCPEGKHLLGEECVDKPCPKDSYLVKGVCSKCPNDTHFHEGNCIQCPSWMKFQEGFCVCPEGQVIRNNTCIEWDDLIEVEIPHEDPLKEKNIDEVKKVDAQKMGFENGIDLQEPKINQLNPNLEPNLHNFFQKITPYKKMGFFDIPPFPVLFYDSYQNQHTFSQDQMNDVQNAPVYYQNIVQETPNYYQNGIEFIQEPFFYNDVVDVQDPTMYYQVQHVVSQEPSIVYEQIETGSVYYIGI